LVEVQAAKILEHAFPAEYCQETQNAINRAVNAGIIVIEPAGNGNQNIDDVVSSGAILVGASKSSTLTRLQGTNFGNRVDVHAWGENVVTTGYATLYGNQSSTLNDDYTDVFGGTSSSSALVAGAAACLQGIFYAYTGNKLTPVQMRNILKNSGIPHQDPFNNIGRRLNLPLAVNYI